MKTIIETVYDVKVAHGQGTKPLLETKLLNTVRSFLKKKKVPYDFDVQVFNWDGYEWEIMTYTGEDFLELSNPNTVRKDKNITNVKVPITNKAKGKSTKFPSLFYRETF